MVSLTQLWLPILLSAVAVFFVSFLSHTVLKYHRSDYARLPNEDALMSALGPGLPVGDYMFPHHGGLSNPMKDPAFVEKRTRGPAGIVTVMPSPFPGMGGYLGQWFVYSLVVSLFAAYLASRALPPDAANGEVFRFTATVAFLGYGMALVQDSIWFGRRWSTTAKNVFDALLYCVATAAIFVWLWP